MDAPKIKRKQQFRIVISNCVSVVHHHVPVAASFDAVRPSLVMFSWISAKSRSFVALNLSEINSLSAVAADSPPTSALELFRALFEETEQNDKIIKSTKDEIINLGRNHKASDARRTGSNIKCQFNYRRHRRACRRHHLFPMCPSRQPE